MSKQETAIEVLFRIHGETAHRLNGSYRSNSFIAKFYSDETLKRYENAKLTFSSRGRELEREFLLGFANHIRSMVKEYNSSLEYLLKVPFYVSISPEGFNYNCCRKMFIDMASGDEKFNQVLRDRPLLNYLSPVISYINRFVRNHYDLISGKMKMEGSIQHSQIIDLFLNIVRGFGLEPIVNDYLRDSNGNILLSDPLIAIQCREVNMAVIISNDLSPKSENEWMNGIIISQLMQRLNKFDYNIRAILFVIHSNQISFFPMTKLQPVAQTGTYTIGFGKVLNIESLYDMFDCITFLWEYLLKIATDSLMTFTFIESLSKQEFSKIQSYIYTYIDVENEKEWKRERIRNMSIEQRAKIAKKSKRKQDNMLDSVISEMHKLLQK